MSPAEVKALAPGELPALAERTRGRILEVVSERGGHLASSLGAVELCIALLRVFDPPRDKVVWDVGHQAYAWKLLTDRWDSFATLRTRGGVSGFPDPGESPFDSFVAGHAGAALSAAEGMAAARDLSGGSENVVAVVGDASLTNGMNLEALNNCAAATKKLILVLNDNAMSISANVGSFARVLGRMLAGVKYNRMKAKAESAGHCLRLSFLSGPYHRIEQLVKSIWLGNAFFESLGLRYIGPVDGHDLKAVEAALTVARDDKRSVVVHVVTQKGRGYQPAEADPVRWHGVGPFDLASGEMPSKGAPTWSSVFGDALTALAREDSRVCALTAAMRNGTGLALFAREFPSRFFDAGICEGHLVTFAAGLAKSGLRPVVALYSSFLQRSIDQIMHDVCLLNLPVVFAIDRAGLVGLDGRTHNGMFDIPLLRAFPNLRIVQPRDAGDMAAALREALASGGPVAIRYPRGACPARVEASEAPDAPLQIWALGDQVPKANAAAELLAARGVRAGVVHARWIKPFDTALIARQRAAGMKIASIENGSVAGGFGEAIGADFRFGWPDAFIPHGAPADLEKEFAFTAQDVADRLHDEFASAPAAAKMV